MAKKVNGTYADVEALEIARKYLSGIKLTDSELSILRMYAKVNDKVKAYLQQGMSARAAGKNAPRAQLNQYLNSMNSSVGSKYRPSSPGGFRASGLDADSDERMNAMVTKARQSDNDPRRARIFRDGSAWVNGRKYSASQVSAAIQRGMSGASMGNVDQAIYDRYMTVATENAQMRQAQEDAARALEREDARKQYNLINSKMELKTLPDGWEYTRSQRKRFNQLQESFVNSRARKDLRPRDKQKFLAEIKQEMQDIVNSPMMTLDQPKSLEQQTKDRIVTINGTQYFIDDSLKPSLLPKTESEFEKSERETQAYKEKKEKEAETKAEKERKEREKWEREEATKKANARKERETAYWTAVNERAKSLMADRVVKENGLENTVSGKSYEEAMAQAQKDVNSAGRFKGYFDETEPVEEQQQPIVEKSVLPVVEQPIVEEEPLIEQPTVERPVVVPQVKKPRTWQNLVAERQQVATEPVAQPVIEPVVETQPQVCPACGGPLENGICYNENCPTNA